MQQKHSRDYLRSLYYSLTLSRTLTLNNQTCLEQMHLGKEEQGIKVTESTPLQYPSKAKQPPDQTSKVSEHPFLLYHSYV